MKLKTLIRGLNVTVRGSKETEVLGISSDSRTLSYKSLFIAKKGARFDGTQFIEQAVQAGASCVVLDLFDPFLDTAQIIHPNPKEIEAKLAAAYYEHPSKHLFTVGVTGTKGKTTTTYLIKHLLDFHQEFAGLIGTIETILKDHRFFSTLTTHDVIFNQKCLKEMLQRGCRAAVLEVSSHGLDQGRVDEIDFDLGVFTNLYPDHLDYHGTMEKYAEAKRLLFTKAKRGVFNADSPWNIGKGMSFGIDRGDLRAEKIELGNEKSFFEVEGIPFEIPLVGRFNVYNALAAICVGVEKGFSLKSIAEGLKSFAGTPGRMQRIRNVFIDFAHTKEALEQILSTLKDLAKGKLIVVFGCGGERPKERRSGMAEAAEKWADLSIVTTDNPRREDPEQIISEIVSFFKQKPLIEADRKKAIYKALSMAKAEDFVLIAGRGHEREQILSDRTLPFKDEEVVLEYFGEKR